VNGRTVTPSRQVAEIDADLAKIAERHAGELAADALDEQRISELEEKRDRLVHERKRLVGRSRAIGDLAIPAAHREAIRTTMGARRKEYSRQGGLLDQSGALLRNALETLRRLDADLPFGEPHPEFLMRQLAEEIGFDSGELGEKPPALDPPARFDNELRELIGPVEKNRGANGIFAFVMGGTDPAWKEAEHRRRAEAAARMGMSDSRPHTGA
jgi:hypothetical protein